MGLSIVLWLIMSLVVMTEYAEQCQELSPFKKILVWIILLVTGPIFCAYTGITQLLDFIIPGEDDDDDKPSSRKW